MTIESRAGRKGGVDGILKIDVLAHVTYIALALSLPWTDDERELQHGLGHVMEWPSSYGPMPGSPAAKLRA
jgi:hypothetical protein